IQTLEQTQHLKTFSPSHFDYIIIDEFHHATAPSYKNLLSYFQPDFMLGLTATPERSDQADILSLCDNNLVFERNLVHGIDEKILVPFHYYGVFDEFVNYEEIPWRNGRFDPKSLDNALATKQRSRHIYQYWLEKKQSRTLAFCVSTKHADYMAQAFIAKGINACAVYNGSSVRRNEALTQLALGSINIVFSVDLFNEGTDLPAIDTILMLRPTKSKVLFLQQLGRGLRQSKSTPKDKLVVIDFIGNHESFLNKPASLLGDNTTKVNPAIIIAKIKKGLDKGASLPDGCFINYAPELIELWQKLAKKYRHNADEDYQLLTNQLGYRPTATEFFQSGYDLTKMRKQCTSWFNLVLSQHADIKLKNMLVHYGDFLLNAIETTQMSKSFKAILLEAFLTLDGFNTPPTTEKLAEQSWYILDRQPDLKRQELPESKRLLSASSKAWHTYWLGNPIKAFSQSSKSQSSKVQHKMWFIVEQGVFKANFSINSADIKALHLLMQELVDLRLAQYLARQNKKQLTKIKTTSTIKSSTVSEATILPFYTDLKIACGHFKNSEHQTLESYTVDGSYGHLTADKHFIARASGNSMNGGKNPILDGDLLLLERIGVDNAGSISNLTMAIELLDETGDEQYLLRVVKKQNDGSYLLHANNPDYEDKIATEQMQTFARLKTILPPN
ncbi:MAG: DEAD/DEAH box helicase family protein, partial [Colwellia sp.]|nr:DEAD/DEAH box helicase family protein [Colwellia sp.]